MKQFLFLSFILLNGLITKSQHTISGTIQTSEGKPAGNVNVALKEQKKYTVSLEDGSFVLSNIAPGKYTISASFAGLQTQTMSIVVENNQPPAVHFILAENAAQLAEVIVIAKKGLNTQPLSAGKVAIDPMDLPQSIAVIGQSVIRDQQSQRLSDIIKNVNGVYLSTTRGNTQESFSARGYGFSSSNMFKNGSRINSGTMPEVSALEKVEVLKGSAAILYGNVAPGGIINMVTKQPKFNYGGEISLRAGSYGLVKPAFDVYGPLSSKIAFRVNGTYEKANSFRDEVTSRRYYINPSLLFKIGKHTELLVQGDYLDHAFTPDFGTGSLADTIIANVPRGRFLGTSWQYNKAKQTTATAALKHLFSSSWHLNATVSYQLYKRDYYATEKVQAKANGDWARSLNKILSQEDYFIGNIDVTGKFKTGKLEHTLLTGIDADRYYTTSYTFNNPAVYDTINILDPHKFIPRTDIPAASKVTRVQTPINRVGAYVQDLISLSAKFKLLAGVRWSVQDAQEPVTAYLLKDSLAKGKGSTVHAFSPRVGLVYKPATTTSVFASFSQSFVPNNNPNGNLLPPSLIDQYEAGIKNDFLKGKLSANLTFYRIINNNLASVAQFKADGSINTDLNYKELSGQTTSDGIEIDISSQPAQGLNILAGYSYNNMRYTDTKDVKGNYVEGERLVNTPAHTANASVFYTFQKGNLKGLKTGVSAFYTGDRWGGWNNTKPAPGQPHPANRLIPVKGFTTTDISAGYTFKKILLLARVSNLFNTYNYYVHENYSINPIAPRQFISTVSVKL
jgi:iron complex outermembrane receptor protein